MNREDGYNLIKKQVKNKNLIKHMLAVEAVMIRLADHFGQDQHLWGMTGLLHDLDYDQTADHPEQHGLVGAEMLEEINCPAEMIQAVKAHNEALMVDRHSLLDKALYAVDPVTGLLVAAALIHPDKKLSAIDVDFVLKRFKEKSFARGASREQIESCSEVGLDLEQFLQLSLGAMQEKSSELGL